METKKKALGKGLEQLFSNNVIDFDNFEDTVIEENKKDVTEINLDEIRSNPWNVCRMNRSIFGSNGNTFKYYYTRIK